MSFLNPVSEPVLMYSSTDANAPQINYAARAAGDVKTVLKACLVTGYGGKAAAGWTIQNETDFTAEFVSPSVAMNDYAFGINDGSSNNTSWYYKYKGTQTNPAYNAPSKDFNYIDTKHADNGWRLLVTNRGIIFIELVQSTTVSKLSARLTYFSALKSAITDAGGINIAFFNIGHDATLNPPALFYQNNYPHFRVENYSGLYVVSATPLVIPNLQDVTTGVSLVDITSQLYVASDTGILIAGLPGILSKVINNTSNIYGMGIETLNGRSVMKICVGYRDERAQYMYARGRVMLIYLDHWDF